MDLEGLYTRLGPRYVVRFLVISAVAFASSVLPLAVLANIYWDGTAVEALGLLLTLEVGLAIGASFVVPSWLRASRPLEDWLRAGRPRESVREVWQATTRVPLLVLRVSYPVGVACLALPAALYAYLVGGVSAIEALIVFAAVVAVGIYAAMLSYFGFEVYMRPALRDLAERASMSLAPARTGVSLRGKLLVALVLNAGAACFLLAIGYSVAERSLEMLAAGMALTLGLTVTTTAIVAILATGSIAGPWAELLESTRRVRAGDLAARVPVVSDDELGVVAASFNEMTADLQRARGELVAAREEERRRLRRDLHDGLGPALAGVAMRLDAADTVVASDPDGARAILAGVRDDTREAIADIRRLVYGLRPPQLDELGLIGAVAEQAARVAPNGRPAVTIAAPDRLPPLPAAVEVAAYRIADEALTNVVRHANAGICQVRISVGNGLLLEVSDDGAGIATPHHSGVGLHSMRERAAELGGTCTAEPRKGGGTVVTARLPLDDFPATSGQESHDSGPQPGG